MTPIVCPNCYREPARGRVNSLWLAHERKRGPGMNTFTVECAGCGHIFEVRAIIETHFEVVGTGNVCDHCGKPNWTCQECVGLVTCHDQCPRCQQPRPA